MTQGTVGVNEYARMRGCSGALVSQKIKKGVLSRAISTDARGTKRIDPVVADVEWERNTDKRFDYTDRAKALKELSPPAAAAGDAPLKPPPLLEKITRNSNLNDIRQAQAWYAAETQRLDFEKLTGLLVETEQVQKEWMKLISEVKTKLLAVPVKAKGYIPELTNADVSRIETLIREALEEVAYADEH